MVRSNCSNSLKIKDKNRKQNSIRKKNINLKFSHTLLDDNFKWSTFRGFGNSKLSQSTIIVPFIAWMILFNEKSSIYFSTIIDGSYPLWKMKFLYFGFSLIAVSFIIYSLFCHSIIKKYSSSEEYMIGSLPVLSRSYNKLTNIINLIFIKNKSKKLSKEMISIIGVHYFDEILKSCFIYQYPKNLSVIVEKHNISITESNKPNTYNVLTDNSVLGNTSYSKKWDIIKDIIEIDHFIPVTRKKESIFLKGMDIATKTGDLNTLLDTHYDILNNEKNNLRITNSVILVSGFTLIAIPSIVTFFQILATIMS